MIETNALPLCQIANNNNSLGKRRLTDLQMLHNTSVFAFLAVLVQFLCRLLMI